MSEIVSFYDWLLDQRTKPKGVAKLIENSSILAKENKDIKDEKISLVKEKNIND